MKTIEQIPSLGRPSMEKKFSSWGFRGLVLFTTDGGEPTWPQADVYIFPASGLWGSSERGRVPRELVLVEWEAGSSLTVGYSHLPVVHLATIFLRGEFRNDTPRSASWLLSWAKEKLSKSSYSLWSGSFRSMAVPLGVHLMNGMSAST